MQIKLLSRFKLTLRCIVKYLANISAKLTNIQSNNSYSHSCVNWIMKIDSDTELLRIVDNGFSEILKLCVTKFE